MTTQSHCSWLYFVHLCICVFVHPGEGYYLRYLYSDNSVTLLLTFVSSVYFSFRRLSVYDQSLDIAVNWLLWVSKCSFYQWVMLKNACNNIFGQCPHTPCCCCFHPNYSFRPYIAWLILYRTCTMHMHNLHVYVQLYMDRISPNNRVPLTVSHALGVQCTLEVDGLNGHYGNLMLVMGNNQSTRSHRAKNSVLRVKFLFWLSKSTCSTFMLMSVPNTTIVASFWFLVTNRNNQSQSVILSCSFLWQMDLFLPTHHVHILPETQVFPMSEIYFQTN